MALVGSSNLSHVGLETGVEWNYRVITGRDEQGFAEVLDAFPEASAARFLRPNLTYRFYRIDSPFSAHVTLVTLSGEDREGWCFSVGSACREARGPSWRKAVLEAVQEAVLGAVLEAALVGGRALAATDASKWVARTCVTN